MLDIAFIFAWLTIFFGIGSSIHSLLSMPRKSAVLINPLLGAAFAVPFSTIAYIYGLSTKTIFGALVFAGSASIVVLIIKARRKLVSLDFRLLRARAPVLTLGIATLLLLIGPRLNGGMQFAVYQANRWDTFNYLEAASAYSGHSFEAIRDVGVTSDPILIQGRTQMFVRPAVHIFYAVSSQLAPSRLWNLHYAFLMIFVLLSACSIAFFLRATLHVSSFRAVVAGCAFALGFWGQYIVDINAWGQLASSPLLICMVSLLISAFASNAKTQGKTFLPIAMFVCASLYVYPEAFVVVSFSIASAIMLVYLRHRRKPAALLPLVIGAAIGLLTSLLFFKGTVGHVIGQYFTSGAVQADWWKEYQAFLVGRDGIELGKGIFQMPVKEILSTLPVVSLWYESIDISSGLLGLYFVTPGPESASAWKLINRVLLLLLIVFLVAGAHAGFERLSAGSKKAKISGMSITLFLLMIGVVIVVLISKRSLWGAGKALSYASPFFVPLLLAPFLVRPGMISKWWVAPALAYIVISFGSGAYRVYAAGQNAGVHYPRPYPVADIEVKTSQDWNLARFDSKIAGCNVIQVDVQGDFFRRDVIVYLTSNRKGYVVKQRAGEAPASARGAAAGKTPDCFLSDSGFRQKSED